jgi:hypothetical protein
MMSGNDQSITVLLANSRRHLRCDGLVSFGENIHVHQIVNQLKGLDLDLFGKFANDDWRFQMDNFVVVHTNRPMPLKGDLTPSVTPGGTYFPIHFVTVLLPSQTAFAGRFGFVHSKNPSFGQRRQFQKLANQSFSKTAGALAIHRSGTSLRSFQY